MEMSNLVIFNNRFCTELYLWVNYFKRDHDHCYQKITNIRRKRKELREEGNAFHFIVH
jgi:hypothetical protein